MSIRVVFSGLTFLYTYEKQSSAPGGTTTRHGEMALLNPSRQHAHYGDMASAGTHVPLLVVRRDRLRSVEGPDVRFPLATAIQAEWLEADAGIEDYVAWSVDGATLSVLYDDDGPTTFREDPIVVDNGCNPLEQDPAGWDSLDWVPSVGDLYPGLRLAEWWRDSPHVGTRFLFGSGLVGGTKPIGVSTGFEKVRFHGSPARVFTDAVEYLHPNLEPAILLDRGSERTIVRLEPGTPPSTAWVYSQDDAQRSPASYEHFSLYSLLPWRFKTPKEAGNCAGTPTNHGKCFGLRYRELK